MFLSQYQNINCKLVQADQGLEKIRVKQTFPYVHTSYSGSHSQFSAHSDNI